MSTGAPHGSKCGPHVELVANDAARITRCACGTVHLHLIAQRLTLQLDGERFRHLANATAAAARLMDMAEHERQGPVVN